MNHRKQSERISLQLLTAILVGLLLFPSLQKIVHPHHHDLHHYHGNEIQINGHEDHCELCSFDFYHYILSNTTLQEISFVSHPSQSDTYRPDFQYAFTGYSFLLRGPPQFTELL